MRITLINKKDFSIKTSFKELYTYHSDVIPCVGDYVLYSEYKTFRVNERVFDILNNTVQLYGLLVDLNKTS